MYKTGNFIIQYYNVGLKKDLRDDTNTIKDLEEQGEQPVSLEQGRKMGNETGAVEFLECSALKRDGVQEVFEAAVRAAIVRRKNKSGCCCTIS